VICSGTTLLFRSRGRFFAILDFVTLIALNLAFLAFTMASIDPRLDILPYYDFVTIQSYQITAVLILIASFLVTVAIYRKSSVILTVGFLVQMAIVLNEAINRAYYIPQFLTISQDVEIYHTIYGNLPISFYFAPSYEYVNLLAFVCFIIGSVCLLVRLSFRIGTLKSILYTSLICSGLLSYLEYMTVYQNLGEPFSLIATGKISNFSKNWYFIGNLTNVQFLWIVMGVFIGTSTLSTLMFALKPISGKLPEQARTATK
jgi:hypothetical protein